MSDTRHARLRNLAEAATPGPWGIGEREVGCIADQGGKGYAILRETNGKSLPSPANRAYIAAANPAAVIALLDEIDALRAERDALLAPTPETPKTVKCCDCGKEAPHNFGFCRCVHCFFKMAAQPDPSPSLAARLSDEVLLKADEAFDDTFARYQYISVDPNEPVRLAYEAMRAVLLDALQGE